MPNLNKTLIAVVLDRSGSMIVIKDAVEAGLNEFVRSQKETPGECLFTLAQFDHEYQLVHDAVDIKSVETITFQPRGNTALLDAMGRTINDVGAKLDVMNEEDRPGKVIIVIQTDGQENASREFTKLQVSNLIKHQQEKYNWEFLFLGANQDAIGEAATFGIGAAQAMTYNANAMGTQNMYSSVMRSVSARRLSTDVNAVTSFVQADRDAQTGKTPDVDPTTSST